MTKTDKIELVETHNLALALQRLNEGAHNGYDYSRWKRALYHALGMVRPANCEFEEIRKALRLP